MGNKKGSISAAFFISVLVLVVTAAVIFLFFNTEVFDYDAAIDSSVCHQSIVLRASAKLGPIDASNAIPLKCQTQKICFTLSGDDCVDLSSTKDNPVKKIKLPKCKGKLTPSSGGTAFSFLDCNEAKDKIIEVIADNLVACHSMVGEGKLNFFPGDWLKKNKAKTNYGLICNRIVFDQQAKDEIKTIQFFDLYNHMGRKTVGDKSYVEYLYNWNSGNSPGETINSVFQLIKKNNEDRLKDVSFTNWNIDLNERNGYATIAILSPHGNQKALVEGALWAGGITVGSLFILSGIGAPVGISIIAGVTAVGTTTGGIVFWQEYKDEFYYAPPTIYPYDVKILQDLNIYSFEIAP